MVDNELSGFGISASRSGNPAPGSIQTAGDRNPFLNGQALQQN